VEIRVNDVSNEQDGDVTVSIASLHVYPIKSCGGVALTEVMVIETGFEFDRAWMVVDSAGEFVTQRQLPRMALIQPTLKTAEMVLRAPGMLALHVALDRVEAAVRVKVWKDEVAAFDMGDLCAQWFTDFLGRPLRLVRFDPEHKRLSDHRWTGALDAENAFADGFPILVASSAGLDELNRRLVARGEPAVTMARFRPNLVLDGLDAHGEDALDEITFATADGPVQLKLVKPCGRCPIPDVDPATGESGHAVGDVLASYRADARLDGALTFGMNAVIIEGIERVLRTGLSGRATYAFD
jgi:uncharacterized protein YcbX